MRRRIVFVIALLTASAACCSKPNEATTSPTLASPADPTIAAILEVRRGYFGRDWWACARAGEVLLASHPTSAPLRAWTIACAARAGEDALPLAETMLAGAPGDPWGLFARASALIDDLRRGPDEGIPAAQAAAQALAHPDTRWLVGRALVVHGAREEATAFLAAQSDRESSPELLGLELALLSTMEDVETQLLTTAKKVRALDPKFVDGWFLPALWLLRHRRSDEAEPLLARALRLSPHSPTLHAELWNAIMQSRERSATQKRAALDADVAALLRARSSGPPALHAAAYAYDDVSPETSRRLRAEILARFPNSREADWVRIEEIRDLSQARDQAMRKGTKPEPAAEKALKTALDDFIARPRHAVPALLGEVHSLRYFLVKEDDDASPETLLAAARGLANHERQNLHLLADAATTLTGRTRYHAEAEALVRAGLQLAEHQLARASPSERVSVRAQNLQSILLCGLGTVLRTQGRFIEARSALIQAHALTRGRLVEPLLGLAALAEAEGRPSAAEAHLLEALTIDSKSEKVEVALKALYRQRHRGERGFDKYRAGVERSLGEQRKAAVLASAIKDPSRLTPFTLQDLNGGM
jgi:tetratricopeptide (TPR) repeat protein